MPCDPPPKRQKTSTGLWSSVRRGLDESQDQSDLRSKSPFTQSFGPYASTASSPGPTDTTSLNVLTAGLMATQSLYGNRHVSSARASASPETGTIEDTTPALAMENHSGDDQKKESTSWTGLETALKSLHLATKIFPPLQSAIGILISCLELVQAATKQHREYGALAADLKNIVMILEKHFRELGPTSMSDSVANVVQSIEKEVRYIEKKKNQSSIRGIVGASIDADKLVQCHRRIESLFRLLQADATYSTWVIAQEHLANTRLEAMLPTKAANYDSAVPSNVIRNECTENTRSDLLAEMNTWSEDPAAAKVYWLNGMAGTGKTTIACSLSTALADRKQLGASFFCTRILEECRDVTRIIPTIAYQLARYSRPFQQALCKVLGNDPDAAKKKIPIQFKRLLKEPLLEVQETIPNNVVVVIDALDECNDDGLVRTLVDTLFQHAADLPLKFFVASRPEPGVLDEMLLQGGVACSVLHLHEIERSSVQADIKLYLRKELAFVSPSEAELQRLVSLSDNLFIYAATTVRYIQFRKKSVNPRERLQKILAIHSDSNQISGSSKIYAELDDLYRRILEGALDEDGLEGAELGRVRSVLWTAVCVREPVTVKTLGMLVGLGVENTQVVLQSLRSVLHVSEANSLVTTLHASFPDFIFTRERSQHFFCDQQSHAPLLTQRCFDIMKAELRFNICKLESSFVPDNAIEDLDDRVAKHISRSLSYACQYWVDHLSLSAPTGDLCVLLEDFLLERLLFWMEVLNLQKIKSLGGIALQRVQSWLTRWDRSALFPITQLVSDTHHFVTLFASSPASICTPHIYISVLPLRRKFSSVLPLYWRCMRGLIDVKGTAMEHQGSAALARWDAGGEVKSIALSPDGSLVAFGGSSNETGGMIGIINHYQDAFAVHPFQGHTSHASSVAFSPDSTRIVSCSYDNTIRVWSAQNGDLVSGPCKGHKDWVNSVSFSPDGTYIVSGSDDRTICVWRAQDGKLVAGPFKGHAGSVNSVAFSPDGTHIISGSDDCTIRLWRARDGKPAMSPFRVHTDSVNSVAFSPDGTRIVSGSNDETICVWSAQDGTPVVGPFNGHTEPVNSVAFSPDGTRIVSGSDDCTVRVWSAHDSALVAGPFKGHTSLVRSVAFLPDGAHIVSGSDDCSIRIWSVQDGNPMVDPFNGHTDSVNSVAFSPDGEYIVSGSNDETICVWKTQDGSPVVGPFNGHSGSVNSVTFSPDGTRIASGSDDRTICVWSAKDGKLLARPFKGHTDRVNSVAFSPDGMFIVSGSNDKTIYLWRVSVSKVLIGPFRGHTDSVTSVKFSPDGTHIVSGSHDKTIRIWDAESGRLAAGPFKGHTDAVSSVAYSPDGTRIVSGSFDQTICVWSAQSGKLMADPFKGHTDWVNSVAFSPDGRYIVSGSYDKSIFLWNADDGHLIAGPFKDHSGSVNSVAFSPDGTHIASSSNDYSIRFIDPQRTVQSAPALAGEWDLKGSGWVVNRNGQYLFWVPQYLHSSLPRLYNSLVAGPEGSLQVDYSNLLLGESWSQCYVGLSCISIP